MTTALLILNPREIPQVMELLRAVPLPKFWASYMNEEQAAAACMTAIRETDFDRYLIISDDCGPTLEALNLVLSAHDRRPDECITGYCNLDSELPFVNLTNNVLSPPPPTVADYGLLTREYVEAYPDWLVPTTFTGLSLTCMSRELWLKHPLEVSSLGGQMDYVLSYSLAQADVPIHAVRGAFMHHVKERWNELDNAPEKRLLIGVRPPSTSWTDWPEDKPQPPSQARAWGQVQRRAQLAPAGQRIIALLSYYNEPVRVLVGCLSAMAKAGVDHVVAFDGRYRLFPGEHHLSPSEQSGAILEVCDKLGMGLSMRFPAGPWEGEVEKRTNMFMEALAVSDPGDWYFVVDADELIQQVPGDLRAQLQWAGEHGYEVAVVTMRDMSAAELNDPSFPEYFSRRSLFAAQPIYVDTNHHTYKAYDGRELWNAKPERDQDVKAYDLTGGAFTSDGAAQEFTDPANAVVVRHYAGARTQERLQQKDVYYTRREEERAERGPCAYCAKEGKLLTAARRVPVEWRKVTSIDKPISDIEELCDEHAAEADEKNLKRLRTWGYICACWACQSCRFMTADVEKMRLHEHRSGHKMASDFKRTSRTTTAQKACRECGKAVDLSAVKVTERNGRPAIV